jgi:hypothetical protein
MQQRQPNNPTQKSATLRAVTELLWCVRFEAWPENEVRECFGASVNALVSANRKSRDLQVQASLQALIDVYTPPIAVAFASPEQLLIVTQDARLIRASLAATDGETLRLSRLVSQADFTIPMALLTEGPDGNCWLADDCGVWQGSLADEQPLNPAPYLMGGGRPLAFAAKKQLIAIARPGGVITLHDRVNQGSPGMFYAGPSAVQGVAFSQDNDLLAGITLAGRVVVWNTTSGRECWSQEMETAGSNSIPTPTSIAFSPDGSCLALGAGLQQGVVYLLTYQSSSPPHQVARPVPGVIAALRIGESDKSLWLASCTESAVTVWRLQDCWEPPSVVRDFEEFRKIPIAAPE